MPIRLLREDLCEYERQLTDRVFLPEIPVYRDDDETRESYEARCYDVWAQVRNWAVSLYIEGGVRRVRYEVTELDDEIQQLKAEAPVERWKEDIIVWDGVVDELSGSIDPDAGAKPPEDVSSVEELFFYADWRRVEIGRKMREHQRKQHLLTFRRNVCQRVMDDARSLQREVRTVGDEAINGEEERKNLQNELHEFLPDPPETTGRLENALLAWVFVSQLSSEQRDLRSAVNEGVSGIKGENSDYVRNLEEYLLPRYGWDGVSDLRSALRFHAYAYIHRDPQHDPKELLEEYDVRVPEVEPTTEDLRRWIEVAKPN